MSARAHTPGIGRLVLIVVIAHSSAFAAADSTDTGRSIERPPHAHAAVMPLLQDLSGEDITARIGAAMALRELGPVAWPAMPALIAALSDSEMGVRKAAAGALGGIGPAAASGVPDLARLLRDPHRYVRSWAAMALYEIGPAAGSAALDLVEMLEADRENLRGRSWCASALPKVKAPPELAVPLLMRVLVDDPSVEVRSAAALSLEAYGLDAGQRDATHALLEALLDPHWKVRGNAACALTAMGPDAVIALSRLEGALRDETEYVRNCATRALAEINPTEH